MTSSANSAAATSTAMPAAVLPFPVTAAALREYRARAAHAAAQERHFVNRVRERFGLRLSPQRYRYWIEKVEQVLPGTEFLHATDVPERTVWRIRSGSYTLHVLYDETTARLVTCFPAPFIPIPIKRLRRLRARSAVADTSPLSKIAAPMAA